MLGDRLCSLPSTLLLVGHDARDRPAVAQNDDSRAILDLVEQLREMGLSDRGLHLSHLPGLSVMESGGIFAQAVLTASGHG